MTYRTASERTRASFVVEVDDGAMAHFDEAGGRPKLLMHQRTMQSSVYDWSVGDPAESTVSADAGASLFAGSTLSMAATLPSSAPIGCARAVEGSSSSIPD